MSTYGRVWAQVDLKAIKANICAMKKNLNEDTKLMAVIKTDGYGHGAVPIAEMLDEESYVWGYAAATAEEAFELRENGIKKPILILGYTFAEDFERLIAEEVRLSVFSYETAKQISDVAGKMGKTAYIHIKIDTGMHRIGLMPEDCVDPVCRIAKLPNLSLEGIFTHFARADEEDKENAAAQYQAFDSVLQKLEDQGITFPMRHCANSAATLELPQYQLDMVRAGITLYGLWPSDEVKRDFPLCPALSLYSHIVYIKTLEKGNAISYGGTFVTERTTRVATIPVGYGDGYPRSLSNKGYVLINGKRAPILGRVCMDQFMVDVTDIPEAKELDLVTLIGEDHGERITVEELGDLSGRFNYEFVCDLGKRVPRVYLS